MKSYLSSHSGVFLQDHNIQNMTSTIFNLGHYETYCDHLLCSLGVFLNFYHELTCIHAETWPYHATIKTAYLDHQHNLIECSLCHGQITLKRFFILFFLIYLFLIFLINVANRFVGVVSKLSRKSVSQGVYWPMLKFIFLEHKFE